MYLHHRGDKHLSTGVNPTKAPAFGGPQLRTLPASQCGSAVGEEDRAPGTAVGGGQGTLRARARVGDATFHSVKRLVFLFRLITFKGQSGAKIVTVNINEENT